MALKRQQATRLPPLEFFKRMRFGLPPYNDDDDDSNTYTLLIGCEPEDNFNFYEKKEPEVVQRDEVSTVKNIEAGESEESKEGENEKEEEDACPTEDSEAEEDGSEVGRRYIEGLQSNSEPEDFVDMRMNLIYECSHRTDTTFRVKMFGCMIQASGGLYEIRVLEGGDGVILADVEALIQRHLPDIRYEIPAWVKFKCQRHIRHVAKYPVGDGTRRREPRQPWMPKYD